MIQYTLLAFNIGFFRSTHDERFLLPTSTRKLIRTLTKAHHKSNQAFMSRPMRKPRLYIQI